MTTTKFRTIGAGLVMGAFLMAAPVAWTQPAPQVFTATATVKGAGGVAATAPVTVTIDRTTPKAEADALVAAFTSGGAAALRKALAGVPQAGSVKIGGGAATPARFAIERTTGGGRLLTIVLDQPLLFVGAGAPGAKSKAGYDFAVIDLEVDGSGNGSGTIAPAAKLKLNQGSFVVEDYAAEVVRLASVKQTK